MGYIHFLRSRFIKYDGKIIKINVKLILQIIAIVGPIIGYTIYALYTKHLADLAHLAELEARQIEYLQYVADLENELIMTQAFVTPEPPVVQIIKPPTFIQTLPLWFKYGYMVTLGGICFIGLLKLLGLI